MTKGVSNEINDCRLAVEHFGILYKPSKQTVKVVPINGICVSTFIFGCLPVPESVPVARVSIRI